MIELTPWWRSDHPRSADLPVSDALPSRTTVAIVGAGITGLNAARVLRRAGVDVTVLDSGRVGSGASTVNGGMVNYGLKASTSSVFSMFGPELGRRFWDESLRSIDLVEEVVKDEGIECAFTRGGAAELGFTGRDLRSFEEEAAWLADTVDFELDLVGPDRIRDVVGSPLFHCALVDRVGAGLHPARYVYGLAETVARAGAVLVEHAEVLTIARKTTGYQVLTQKGKLFADTVILATNGYTGPAFPELRRRVVPVGSYIVVTEPLDADTAESLIPGNRMMWTARRFLDYFRRTPDDRILLGGRQDLSTHLDWGASGAVLGRRVGEVFPAVAEVPITHSWGGTLGVTFDLMPHIGRVDGMWYALGYGGHGVGIATLVGSEVAGLITGEIDESPFAEIPHPTRWYYKRSPWFLPYAARLYRMLDRAGL